MKKIALITTLALTLFACGGNPNGQGGRTAKAQQPDSPSALEFERMQEIYDDSDEDHGWKPLCKWQYVDLTATASTKCGCATWPRSTAPSSSSTTNTPS